MIPKRKDPSRPVTEEETEAALPKWDHSWVRNATIYGEKQTTSPLCYQLCTMIGIMGITCPPELKMRYAGDMHVSFFGMCVGRSGEDQKSSAIGIGRELLYEAGAELIGSTPASAEGCIESLSKKPQQMLIYKEMGKLLSSANGGYLESLKTLYTDLWDCEPQQRVLANDKIITVEDPRLIMLSACSIPYLEKYTQPHDWEGGFLGRWAVMYGKRERCVPDPSGDTTDFHKLKTVLSQYVTCNDVGEYRGLTTHAKQMWEEWFYAVDRYDMPDLISGTRSRSPAICRKVALIYAWERGLCSDDWQLDEETLQAAINFTNLHLYSVVALNSNIAEHEDAKLRRNILHFFADNGDIVSYGKILREMKFNRKIIDEMLDTLVASENLEVLSIGKRKAYKRVDSFLDF
jgi:hypothetical protein